MAERRRALGAAPLIGLADGVPVRRAAALSALAVACAGGVNATAVLAVLPLAALWLLDLHPSAPPAALAAGLAVGAAHRWWLVPLLLLGRYSPPFLDYIETAPVPPPSPTPSPRCAAPRTGWPTSPARTGHVAGGGGFATDNPW